MKEVNVEAVFSLERQNHGRGETTHQLALAKELAVSRNVLFARRWPYGRRRAESFCLRTKVQPFHLTATNG